MASITMVANTGFFRLTRVNHMLLRGLSWVASGRRLGGAGRRGPGRLRELDGRTGAQRADVATDHHGAGLQSGDGDPAFLGPLAPRPGLDRLMRDLVVL